MTARCRHIPNQVGSRGKVLQSPSAIGLFIERQRITCVVDIEAQDTSVALIVEVLNVYPISIWPALGFEERRGVSSMVLAPVERLRRVCAPFLAEDTSSAPLARGT